MINLILLFGLFVAVLLFVQWKWMRHQSSEMEGRLRTSFQSISFEVLERSFRTFLDLAHSKFAQVQEGNRSDWENRQKTFESLIVPLRDTMKGLEDQQRDLEKNRASAYTSLFKQIEMLMRTESDLRKETAQLSGALRSPPVRGAWGQIHLRRVVELAGLLNRCDFSEQTSHEQDGKILRPDLIIHLPEGRHIIIDAKTPLNAYLDALEVEDESQRRRLLEGHVAQVRKHIRDLAQKEYWKRFELSPEFVILYLPAESFFSTALQIDPELIEVGAEQNVIIATPTTLIAILRTIAHSWKQEAISKNAEQIALLGQELYERLGVLSDHWEKLGRALTTAVDSYNQAMGSYESRVLVAARKLKEHGAAPANRELDPLPPIKRIVETSSAP